ncbi:uncharacterized protein LOC101897969 isoform X2 [Musca domestica]|uniref:Uncharacterized protein LOC101897969 isoform X2 n=1 Tax=Musca domestica TaxID=7370 RepID=A0ABM3VJ57_MUSDO|nr:uncharacterized protein LOC101897969 isoform X2 [Musca domestica]
MSRQRWLYGFYVFVLVLLLSCRSSYGGYANNDIISSGRHEKCPNDGVPVCSAKGSDFLLFPNQCLLTEANRNFYQSRGEYFPKFPLQRCIHGCRIACPKEYKPICAINLQTRERKLFVSLCELTKYACKTSLDWRVIKYGICDEDYSNSRLRLDIKPPKLHGITKRSYEKISYSPNQEERQDFLNYKTESMMTNENRIPSETYPNYMLQYQNPFLMTPHMFQPMNPFNHIYPDMRNMYAPEETQRPLAEENNAESVPDQQFEGTDPKPMPYSSLNDMPLNYADANIKYENEKHNFVNGIKYENEIPNFYPNNINIENESPIVEPVVKSMHNLYNRNFEDLHTDQRNLPLYGDENMIPLRSYNDEFSTRIGNKGDKSYSSKANRKEKTNRKRTECKYGSVKICGVLSNGTVRTFENICEMRSTNLYLKNTFVKLHEGRCDKCNYDCEREYQPICVQRNGVNYTMVNECYFNMAICLDKISNWTKVANGECHRKTPILDRYENQAPGFKYTSNYFAPTATESMPTSTTEGPAKTNAKSKQSTKSSNTKAKTAAIQTRKENNKELEDKSLVDHVVRRRSNWSMGHYMEPEIKSFIMDLVHQRQGNTQIGL